MGARHRLPDRECVQSLRSARHRGRLVRDTARCKQKWLAPLPPVVLNMLLVGAMLAYEEAGASAAFGSVFLFNAATVGIGEAIACYGLGMLLLYALEKSRFFQNRRRMTEIPAGSGAKSGENA